MEILYFSELNSTHLYLVEAIKSKKLSPPVAIVANKQTKGIGTRGSNWQSIEGNLFFSMCLDKKDLPKDLKIQSISIYYAYLMKEVLSEFGSKVWIKWPNDFYIDSYKAGGVLTQLLKDKVICSIGLNLVSAPKNFKTIDINISKEQLVDFFILKVKNSVSWKYIFSKYRVEFEKSRAYFAKLDGDQKVSLKEAVLEKDGSITIKNKRVYSKR